MSTWRELEAASVEDWEDGPALEKALELWRCENDVRSAAIFCPEDNGGWRRLEISGEPGDLSEPSDGEALDLPGGVRLAYHPSASEGPTPAIGAAGLLLATGARLRRLSTALEERRFQDNYRAVTLEALYDVGLQIASTLNLEKLSEEVLLRAVSLLDARRGALYLMQQGDFVLNRTIGGIAQARVDSQAPEAVALLRPESADAEGASKLLLEGATHALAAPIAIEGMTRGLLLVADKESRTGVGPFVEGDRLALSLFANQAAIALENARLHREALEKERLERELELAAEIQRGLLPGEMPNLGALEVAGWNRPTQQVGGDYYGSLSLDDSRTGIVVADVTGKGMPAALLVSTLHSALHLLLEDVKPGAELVERLNQHIADSSGSNKFITLILVVVDPRGEEIGFLNAGHNPGLVIRAAGGVDQLLPGGLPLGLLPNSSYRFDRIALQPGDLICLYSDGITECEAPDEEEYGLERLAAFLTDRRERPLPGIIEDLDRDVARHGQGLPQGDDQTVVLLRRQS